MAKKRTRRVTATATRTDTQNARQESVVRCCRDLSTGEITTRMQQATTLIAIHEANNARCQRIINVARDEQSANNAVMAGLRADIATYQRLIAARRGC